MTKQERNDAVLLALGHPIRRAILRQMDAQENGGVSPKELADSLQQSIPLIAYHMRLLAKPGIVKMVKTLPRRGAVEHFYARTGNALDKRATEMLDLIGKD